MTISTELLPDLTQFRINVSFTERLIGVRSVIISKLFRRRFEAVKWQDDCNNRSLKVLLKCFDLALDNRRLALGININRATVFIAHFVQGRTGMGQNMHIDQDLKRNEVRVKRNNNRLGIALMRGEGFDMSLLHIVDTQKRLEHCFGAPVTTTTKADLHLVH